MRGTTKINNNNSLYYLNKNYNNFLKVTNQTASQRQVLELEDDPLSSSIGMKMSNIISRTEQYNRNIKTGIASLNLLDGKLGGAKKQLDSIKSIITGAANDPTTPEGRSANAVELNEVLRSLVMTGNSKDGSRYIFGGQNTTTPPFTIVNGRYVNYTGTNQPTNIIADNGTTFPINMTGEQAYGNMITTIPSRDMNPDVSLVTDHSTRLADLNGGAGVPKGKITVYYSSYPEGLEVDLSSCDTLEDVKDAIESATLQASRDLDPAKNPWLNGKNLDWRDMQDRYVKVTVNPEHNGISLQEFDRGEPLPEPTVAERQRGLDYSRTGNYFAGGLGIAQTENVETVVYDKANSLYPTNNGLYPPLRVDDYAQNGVASALGIKGAANQFNRLSPNPVLDGFLHGKDLDPRLSDRTLLADLEGYNDSVYTFTNGSKPGAQLIRETSQDKANVFSEWKLSGLSKGDNTGPNGELYAKAVNRGTDTEPEIYIEIYSCPPDKAKAGDLVATGVYNDSRTGGTVTLKEANNSGLSGTVGIVLPDTVSEASVSLEVEFGENLTASVHVPAFVEEQNPDGTPRDIFNIASGWNLRGLDKPPADGFDQNHPASTDLDGDVSVNYRYDPDTRYLYVELSRPSYSNQPAAMIATGKIYMGDDNYGPPTGNLVSGRIQLVGAPGFEGVKGSVYLEIPAGANFASADAAMGNGAAHPTSITYRLQSASKYGNAATPATIVFGGSVAMQANQAISNVPWKLKGDTLFAKGTIFEEDIRLPNGGIIRKGEKLPSDVLIPRGTTVQTKELIQGTILAEGQAVAFESSLAANTVVPRGSYYSAPPSACFPSDGMAMTLEQTNPYTGNAVVTGPAVPIGYDVRATFATIEDFNRAVEEAGIYVKSQVSEDGKGLEFRSSLAGAWLTVSEDTDCYEQMGDKYQQLAGLDLSGLVKGATADKDGNVYTEVVFYPPDPLHPDRKVQLVAENGDILEVEPGYYVRVYSDSEEMKKEYANRDNNKLVAEGFVPAGQWSDPIDPANPFLPKDPVVELGLMYGLQLEERNESGVWGTVDLDYYGSRPKAVEVEVTKPDGTTVTEWDYNPYVNDQITVYPGGLRPEGTRHATIQEWDVINPMPGVNCDYSGTFHGEITGNSTAASGVDIRMYKDTSHTNLLGRTDPALAPENGRIPIFEVDKQGEIYEDANHERVILGYVTVEDNRLPDGVTDDFKLTTGGLRNGGQEREENVFSTINDAIDALHENNVGLLHDLIGNAQIDIDRIVSARGEAAARNAQLDFLSERHADDVLKYTQTLTSRVGMDDQALAMAVLNYQSSMHAYNAAMQVSSNIMQMSLLSYL